MSRIQVFRVLINERLSAAAEEIFGVFERMIIQYEGEIDRQRGMLDVVMKIQTDHLQLPVCEEEVHPEQQERSSSLGQEESEPLQVKEVQEELIQQQEEVHPEQQERSSSLSQEESEPLQIKEEQEELIQQQEEAASSRFTLILEKRESDEEKTQCSEPSQTPNEGNRETNPLACTSTEQMKTEPDGEDCGVSEPASHLDPAGGLEPTGDSLLLSSDYSDAETENRGDYWRETRAPQSDLNPGDTEEGQSWSISNNFPSTVLPHELESSNHFPFSLGCKVCIEPFPSKRSLIRHIRVHSRGCGLCGKHLEPAESLEVHLSTHRKCDVCGKRFKSVTDLERHRSTHTGQRPFSCSLCCKTFALKENLKVHMRTHTGERPFRCPVCGKGFGQKGNMNKHMISHTGERPFSCSLCGKGFTEKGNLQKHIRIHTGEKPYGCSSCGKRFNQMPHLKKHKCPSESARPADEAAGVRGHSSCLW